MCPEDDTLPQRVLREKLEDGVAQGIGLSESDLDMMIAGYYRARGWTEDGHLPASLVETLFDDLGLRNSDRVIRAEGVGREPRPDLAMVIWGWLRWCPGRPL